jgi:hypothetical protein
VPLAPLSPHAPHAPLATIIDASRALVAGHPGDYKVRPESRGEPTRLDSRRQRSEQYFTSAHDFSHFFRQKKGRPQCAHRFSGKCGFLCIA